MTTTSLQEASIRLQNDYIATTVTINRWTPRKAFTVTQRQQAACQFGAAQRSINASKRLLNPKHPVVKAVNILCTKIKHLWVTSTHPYVESDKRLLKTVDLDSFTDSINANAAQLMDAVAELQHWRDEIIEEARQSLQELFDEKDYPVDFRDSFSVLMTQPNITPPEYLKIVNPQEYQQRLEQFQLQMQQTVLLAEQTLADELAGLVHNLSDRLGMDENGHPRVFRANTLHTLQEFFSRFTDLKIREGTEIEGVVRQAQELLNGYQAGDLREASFLRTTVHAEMQKIEEQLAPLITSRARRRLNVRPNDVPLLEEPA